MSWYILLEDFNYQLPGTIPSYPIQAEMRLVRGRKMNLPGWIQLDKATHWYGHMDKHVYIYIYIYIYLLKMVMFHDFP